MDDLLATEIDMGLLKDYLDGVRYYIDEREESVKSLLPVTEFEELGNPYCMVDKGFIEADFSTTWTSTDPDLNSILDAGGADVEITWDGFEIDFNDQGAFAGPAEDGYGHVILAAGFEGENGLAYAIPVFYFGLDELTDGLEVPLDWGEGSLLFMDETTGWEPINIGDFWGGTARFDAASPIEGAEVTGTISSGIYTWEEYVR